MKQKLKYGITIAVCGLLLGCSTMFTGIVTVTEVVDAAMKNWAHASVARQTTPEFNAQVVRLHDNYRKAAASAQLSLKLYKSTNQATNLVDALAAAKDGALPLVDFIAQILTEAKGTGLKTQLAKATQP